MTNLRSTIRRCGPAFALFSALLLLGTVWIVGIHHHDPATAHTCAVCTTAHAPAVVSITTTISSAPRTAPVRVLESISVAPDGIAPGIAPSRAPPLV
jgi:hypothetical protein